MMVQLIKLFLMALLVNDVFTFPMEGDLFARFERAVSCKCVQVIFSENLRFT